MNKIRSRSKRAFLLLIILPVFFLAGCVALLPPPNPNNPVARVAVLPMANNTNNLDGPVFVRETFNTMVPSRYYETIDLKQIDEVLNHEFGVTLGEQLDFTNPGAGAPLPNKVGEALMVDALFYGTLIEFNQVITGIYNKRQVKAKFKLINYKTGEVMWEDEKTHSTQDFQLSLRGALEAVAKEVVTTAVAKAVKVNPLPNETNIVVKMLMQTIPSGPVAPKNTR